MTPANDPNQYDDKPWYRQFWPWFLMGLPASVVVAGLTTVYIASTGADDLVVSEYYKDGLAINQQLSRQQYAKANGLSAEVSWQTDGEVLVVTSGNIEDTTLSLRLSHPIEADKDIQVPLVSIGSGRFRGSASSASTDHKWLWILEPAQNPRWRLDGELN